MNELGKNELVKIIIFKQEDLKKSGGFKKRSNIKELSETEFFDYLKQNSLHIKSQYFDAVGDILKYSDEVGYLLSGEYFKCSYRGIIIGTSTIVERYNNLINKA